jgi:hypothetical protein
MNFLKIPSLIYKESYSLIQGLMYVAICFFNKKTNIKESHVLILLTGPSIEKDVSLISELNIEYSASMGVNSFALNVEFLKFKPKYYAIYDRSYFLDKSKIGESVANELLGTVQWEMHVFLPAYARNSDFCNILRKNSNINISYSRYYGFDYNSHISRWFALKGVSFSRAYNVLVWALFHCNMLSARKISIAGADFNLQKRYSPIGYRKAGIEGSDFHQTNKIKGNYVPDMAESLEMIVLAYRALYFIDDVFKIKRIEVKVITKGTGIDCFQ